jgi:hypothetical protein
MSREPHEEVSSSGADRETQAQRLVVSQLTREEEAPLPSQPFGRPSRKRGILIALGMVVVFAGGIAAFGEHQRRTALEATQLAQSDLTTCLLGEIPEDGRTAAVSYRRHQVAWLGSSSTDRGGNAKTAWPARCSEAALRVFDHAGRAGLGDELSLAAKDLAKTLTEDRAFTPGAWEDIEREFSRAAAAKLRARLTDVEPPPAHPRALTVDDLRPESLLAKKFIPIRSIQTSAHTSGEPLFLVDDDDAVAFYCFRAPTKLRCARIAPEATPAKGELKLLGSAAPGVAPLVIDSRNVVMRADSGRRVDELKAVSGYVREDELAVLVASAEGTPVLSIQRKEGGPTVRLPLAELLDRAFDGKPPAFEELGRDLVVAQGYLFVRGLLDDALTLHALPLSKDGRLGAPVLLTRAWVDSLLSISTCAVGTSTMVRIDAGSGDLLATLTPDGRAVVTQVGSALANDRWCEGGAFMSRSSIGVQRCVGPKCTTQRVLADPKGDRAPRAGVRDLGHLGSELVFVWGATEIGGVRLLQSAGGNFAEAKDFVVFDDRLAEGRLTDLPTVTELRVFGGDESALALLATAKGLAAVRLMKDGTLAPDTIEWMPN